MRSLWFSPLVVVLTVLFAAASPAVGSLTFELSAPKTEYLLDEPLNLLATIKNTGKSEVRVLGLLDPSLSFLGIQIMPPVGESFNYRSIFPVSIDLDSIIQDVVCLSPGESYSGDISLYWMSGDNPSRIMTVLNTPGEYAITASFTNPNIHKLSPLVLRSNTIRLTVNVPAGEDLAAHKILRSSPHWEKESVWNLKEGQKQLFANVISRHPQSGYAVHALCAMSTMLKSEEEIRSWAHVIENAAKEVDDPFLSYLLTTTAARNYAALGEIDASERLFKKIFLSSGISHMSRRSTITFLELLEDGYYQVGHTGSKSGPEVRLPIRQVAEVLGFEVEWNPAEKTATVSSPRMQATIRPDTGRATVDGIEREEMASRIRAGKVEVSPTLVKALVEAHYACGDKKEGKPVIFLREVPAELTAQLDRELGRLSKKYPLTDEAAADIEKTIGRFDSKTEGLMAHRKRNEQEIRIREIGDPAIPVIARLLVSENAVTRIDAALALRALTGWPKPMTDDRLTTLALLVQRSILDKEMEVRKAMLPICYGIGRTMGKEIPEDIVKVLEKTESCDPEPYIRQFAHMVRVYLRLTKQDFELIPEDLGSPPL